MKQFTITLLLLVFGVSFAQKKDTLQDVQYIYKGNQALKETKFATAEAQYRKAISENPANSISKFNLGNAYYKNKNKDEALQRFNQAQKVADSKPEKHNAFHNMGNVFMQKKEYGKAIEMYKNALRNDPTDDETRYNLALAKKEKEKQDKKDDKNKDKKDDKKKEGKDKDNKKDKNKDDKKDKDGKNKKDKKDKGDDKKDKDKKKDDKGDKNKDKPKDKKDDPKKDKGDQKEKQKQQPKPGQLSPQQAQQLLKAMDNQEQKLQQKLNAKKGKGVPVQNDKDW